MMGIQENQMMVVISIYIWPMAHSLLVELNFTIKPRRDKC